MARSFVLQQRPYTFAQTNLSVSFFACDTAADHTFLFAKKPGLVNPCAFPSADRTGGRLASSCPEVFIVGEMIPTLLPVLCTRRSDSSSPQSGSVPKGLHSRRVAAVHRARPESPRGRTCKAPGRAQGQSGSATRLPGADRGAPAPASNSRVRSRSLPESSEPSIDRGSVSVSSGRFAPRRSSVYGRP